MANPAPAATPTRKSVTGFVTKLVGDGATYGFINDEIFFQQTNVTDGPAGMGDRVFAECEYSDLLPIKWNATSIKIIGRASTDRGPASGGILDSDPRRQSRQSLLNQQQPVQAPPNQSLPAANTYQQHRQQRQPQSQDVNMNQAQIPVSMAPQSTPAPTMALLDQPPMNQQPDFFSPFAGPPPPIQDLQPFQHDIPMGPPKLEYTSQLGSAFVQNQFMAGPLLPQPTQQQMLPQHQPLPQQQQQQQSQHQRQQHQTNNRDQRGARDTNNKGNRFNDKNDRNQSNRGRNRTDKKYEQPRSNERENSANNRSSRASDSRDRSSGHGDNKTVKRDESNATNRQSPIGSTGRATNTSSDRGHNKSASRRYYDAQNIPKTSILTDLNGCNMRSRCSSSVHVPSDLKSIIVNPYLRLDIKNTPKPISFKIESPTTGAPEEAKSTEGDESKPTESETITTEAREVADVASEDAASQSSVDTKNEQITPPSSKSDSRLNHKYGVKVVLVSLPELESIYKKVFGNDLDSFSNESKTHPRLDEAIALLCNKGSSGGHSLIGGKFDPTLDGFVEGETNEFERYGKQPDLIATCRRVVLEQTGLDLGPCQGWSLISTFMYNNKSDYFSTKSSIEYSYIYLPHIWSMIIEDLNEKSKDKESLQICTTSETQDANVQEEPAGVKVLDTEAQDIAAKLEPNESKPEEYIEPASTAEQVVATEESSASKASPVTLDNITDLKVAELKLELDKRDIKYKPNAKKAELVQALQESFANPATASVIQENASSTDAKEEEQEQPEEGEVIADDDNTNEDDGSAAMVTSDLTTSNDETKKRKFNDTEGNDQHEAKKACPDDANKTVKVDLIKDPFSVRSRLGQLQLSMLTLHEAVLASRHDQFELSVASTVLKESLVQHLSEYIFTTLIEESRHKLKEASDSSSTSSSNSQDVNSNDTNNNHTETKPQSTAANQAPADKVNLVKEYPVDRYINLAFSYFDSSHMGYIQADDLFKLFNNTGLTISKRALWSLIGEGDKFHYRSLPDLLTKFPPSYVYRFPDHFERLPGSSKTGSGLASSAGRMVEYQGVKYDVEKLIQQVRDAEVNQVNMVQRFNDAISKFDQQEATIHTLEVSQSSLQKSIKTLNAEISDLKRDKQSGEKRVETLKKQIKEAIKTLSE